MKKVVVNGTFDVLHKGHIELLQFAKEQGDYLLVLIDSDERVKELKGSFRPINKQEDRKFLLESLSAVDNVIVFNSDIELRAELFAYDPDVMVKGDDYKDSGYIGQEFCKETIWFNKIPNYSSTSIIKEIS